MGKLKKDINLRHLWIVLSILLELGPLCMLRPGELLQLQHSDFALPGSFSLGQNLAAIRVVSPKNRRQFGEQQFVTLSNPNCIAWLIRDILEDDSPQELWPRSSRCFSNMFKQLLVELGLGDPNFLLAV